MFFEMPLFGIQRDVCELLRLKEENDALNSRLEKFDTTRSRYSVPANGF